MSTYILLSRSNYASSTEVIATDGINNVLSPWFRDLKQLTRRVIGFRSLPNKLGPSALILQLKLAGFLKIKFDSLSFFRIRNTTARLRRPCCLNLAIAYLPGLPWVWGFPWGFQWGFLWVWDGYGDWNAIPTAALVPSIRRLSTVLLVYPFDVRSVRMILVRIYVSSILSAYTPVKISWQYLRLNCTFNFQFQRKGKFKVKFHSFISLLPTNVKTHSLLHVTKSILRLC